jgi:hypothetical protein
MKEWLCAQVAEFYKEGKCYDKCLNLNGDYFGKLKSCSFKIYITTYASFIFTAKWRLLSELLSYYGM